MRLGVVDFYVLQRRGYVSVYHCSVVGRTIKCVDFYQSFTFFFLGVVV